MFSGGWSRQEIGIEPDGYAMFGYGMWHHRARGKQSPLHARAVCLRDEAGHTVYFCCLDLGYVSHAVREEVVARLRGVLGVSFDESQVVITCTHTHSGPGGCSHEALYNVVTPGLVTTHFEAVVAATVEAIVAASRALAPVELTLHEGRLADETEVAWNRSVHAHNRNPDVTKRAANEAHLAINRNMRVLALRREGKVSALISWFGVHATALGNKLERIDADNKGYAARHAEAALRAAGQAGAVAIFAQSTAGDVSPHYHGPGQTARRAAIKGEAEYVYAQKNGERQADCALQAITSDGAPIAGAIDSIFGYADFNHIAVDARFANGRTDATTSEPCQGVAFFQGTPCDGPGIGGALAWFARTVAGFVKRRRLANLDRFSPEQRAYYERIYAAQGDKAILLESGGKNILGAPLDRIFLPDFVDPVIGELKRQVRIGAIKDSELVPTVLPLQIVKIGSLVLACMPGEFTTTAGARLEATLRAVLGDSTVQITTYCNDYMGYVTTNEEYGAQAYEGGHTVYGQWTLGAFQTRAERLAIELGKPDGERKHDRALRPRAVPAEELRLRTDIAPPRGALPRATSAPKQLGS